MTEHAEIERLLQMTGRTLEGLPETYSSEEREKHWHALVGNMKFGDVLLHQSDVIELLVGALRDALTERDAALAKVPRWISVEDELPPRERNILAVNGHGRIKMLALWKKEEKRWTWIEDSRFTHRNDITHWMPLPSEPEEGE